MSIYNISISWGAILKWSLHTFVNISAFSCVQIRHNFNTKIMLPPPVYSYIFGIPTTADVIWVYSPVETQEVATYVCLRAAYGLAVMDGT